jgi:hypothetical protein
MGDYRYDQSPLSKGLMGAGQALTGVAGAISKAAEMKNQAAAMQSKIDLAKMQFSSLKLKNIQSLPTSGLRYQGLMSKAGQDAYETVFGIRLDPKNEDDVATAKGITGNHVAALTVKMWELAPGLDFSDKKQVASFYDTIKTLPEYAQDPAGTITALQNFIGSRKSMTEIGKSESIIKLNNANTRKADSLADVYSTGVTSKSVSTSTTTSNRDDRKVTVTQKKNSLTNELKAWQSQAFKAKKGMDDLIKNDNAFKETTDVNDDPYPTKAYIEYANQFNEADRRIKDINQQMEDLESQFKSNPLSTPDSSTTTKTTESGGSVRKKTSMQRYQELTNPTPEMRARGIKPVDSKRAYEIIGDEVLSGDITK